MPESAHSVYLKHVYTGTLAETFLGDHLFGAYRTIPIEDRVDNAVKRVQKLTTTAKATLGQSSRGGSSVVKRVGAAVSMGTGRGTTTTISDLVKLFLTANHMMGPLAAMGAAEMEETTGSAHVLYANPLGTWPSSVPRVASPKHQCFFPPGSVF